MMILHLAEVLVSIVLLLKLCLDIKTLKGAFCFLQPSASPWLSVCSSSHDAPPNTGRSQYVCLVVWETMRRTYKHIHTHVYTHNTVVMFKNFKWFGIRAWSVFSASKIKTQLLNTLKIPSDFKILGNKFWKLNIGLEKII